MLKKIAGYMTPFEWFEVLGVTAFTIYFALIDKESEWWYILLSSLAAICGIFCVVLCAGGRRAQYYWGIVNTVAYAAVAFVTCYYGEVMLNLVYYLPTQFIGIWLWSKNRADDGRSVMCKKLKWWQSALLLLASGVGVWLYKLLLEYLGGSQVWLDSISTVLSLIANLLMMLRYREQWLLWIVVDAVTVAMWLIAGDYIMTAMWAFYLLNAIYGYITWTRLNKSQTQKLEAQ